ncbi:MAG: peptidase U32 family protein, partial [Eubacteriales bacterium]
MKKKPEILAPAGNFEKLTFAVLYGADAVYAAGKQFGMRAASENFSDEELIRAVGYCHERGVKLYITVNVMPRQNELQALADYLRFLGEQVKPDALIVSDFGVLSLAKKYAPTIPLHISTQASTVNAEACKLYHALGASRVVLSRELTLTEIRAIREALPDEVELEAFVHGAMCISYSGRCLLSNFFTRRDANHGGCAQPCRWE